MIGGDDNLIGGTAEGEGNVISGNEASGLQLSRTATIPRRTTTSRAT